MKNAIHSILLLSIFFMFLSEKLSFVNGVVALVVGLFVHQLNKKTALSVSAYLNHQTLFKWIVLIPILFFEVVKANFQVAKIALSIQMNIAPQIVIYESRIHDELLLTILANVITLTPGTMTVDIEENKLKVHCLNQAYADGLKDMRLETLLYEIEGALVG